MYEDTDPLDLPDTAFPRIEVINPRIVNFQEVGRKVNPHVWCLAAGYLRYTDDTNPGKELAFIDGSNFIESMVARILSFNEDKGNGNSPYPSFEKVHRNWTGEVFLEIYDNVVGVTFEFSLEGSSTPVKG